MSGIFGVASKKNCSEDVFLGTDYHTHLGTEYGGMAVLDEEGKLSSKIGEVRNSQFKSKLHDKYHQMKGKLGIGVISDKYEQPLVFQSKFGPFALVTAGLIENQEELGKELIQEGVSFSEFTHSEVNGVELVAKLICKGKDIIEGIQIMFDKIKGSTSLLLLHKDGIYAARDKFGRTPLIIGEKEGSFAVTFETAAFPNLHYKITKFLGPGEIVLLTENGIKTRKEANGTTQICTFLWVYTGFPASTYEGVNVEITRENSGKFLAQNDNVKIDFVCGVPDSGVGHGMGYAMESRKPYRRALVKYTPGYGRSYTPPTQELRDRIALMKLIAISDIIKGKRMVVCDDSIVRGTQFKNYTLKKLWNAGAKEVHGRIACPPLMFPCIYNLSTRTTGELAARRAIKAIEGKDIENVSEYVDQSSEKYKKMVDWIAKDIGFTSLYYQKIGDVVKAIGVQKEKLCTHCWDGNGCKGC